LKKLFSQLFVEKTSNSFIQFFRYFFVGGTAFAVDFLLLAFLTEIAGINYLLSAAISFIAGLICNYFLSIKWVFNERKLSSPWIEFFLFGIIGLIGLGLNVVIIWFFTEKISVYYLYSKIIATVIIFFWNFFARKLALFTNLKKV
jgi:putative flippase GtrA